jgi:hypothetical protein
MQTNEDRGREFTSGDTAPQMRQNHAQSVNFTHTSSALHVENQGIRLKNTVARIVPLIWVAMVLPGQNSDGPKLFIVNWDPADMRFITRSISLPYSFAGSFEHVTFAPINLPSIPQ